MSGSAKATHTYLLLALDITDWRQPPARPGSSRSRKLQYVRLPLCANGYPNGTTRSWTRSAPGSMVIPKWPSGLLCSLSTRSRTTPRPGFSFGQIQFHEGPMRGQGCAASRDAMERTLHPGSISTPGCSCTWRGSPCSRAARQRQRRSQRHSHTDTRWRSRRRRAGAECVRRQRSG